MQIKGFEKFREKVPLLSGNKIFLLPLYWFTCLGLSILLMRGFDVLPAKLEYSGMGHIALSLMPLIGELLVSIIGLFLVYQMWAQRKKLKARYGPLSYQRIFFVGFAGISCIMSLSVNQFMRSLSLPVSSPLGFLTVTPEMYWGSFGIVILWIRLFLALFFTVLAIVMVIRSLQTFGFDYMAVIYLYFPEESKLQNHEIYSVLRHPAYTSFILLGLGGTFATATLYSLLFFTVIVATFYIHVHFVEEKELIERFGSSYQEYIKKVPAFFIKPDKVKVFLKFLIGKAEG